MHIFAYICLLLAFLASLGGSGLALIQLWEKRSGQLALIRNASWLVSGCLALASALLLHALFWENYRFEYVASYTDSVLPVFYRLTAFWAGQPGSMLFWALATAICGSLFPLTRGGRDLPAPASLWFWALFYAIMAFFCLLLASFSNPFLIQEPAPVDGRGLNPLLQNPGMIFHPPLLFLGYAGLAIPACLGLAHLASASSPDWFRITRPFWLPAWLCLTAGIVLGAWWAYMELGWGGYWAWDPVENASLLPWLCATAAIHIIAIDARSGKLDRTAAALMALALVAAFFATWLTRSGVIQSVHAFGDGGVGIPLLVFIIAAFILAIFISLAAKPKEAELAPPLTREGGLILVAWLMLALAAIIATATMWPVISRAWGAQAQGLDAAFYNRVCLPLAALLILLLAACFWAGWQSGLKKTGFWLTCAVFVASLAVIWFLGYQKPLPLVCASAAIAAIFAALWHLTERAAWKSGSRLSALGAHLGVAILALGVSFSGPYTTEKDIFLASGQSEAIGPYVASLEKIQDGAGAGYDYLRATLKISENGSEVGILEPERRIYAKFGDMQFSEVSVISSSARDIYASLLGMDEDHRVMIRISLEPLVNWIWLGGALMCLLPLAGLGRSRRKGGHA